MLKCSWVIGKVYNYQEVLKIYGNRNNLELAIRSKKIYRIDKGIYSNEKNEFKRYDRSLRKSMKLYKYKKSLVGTGFL